MTTDTRRLLRLIHGEDDQSTPTKSITELRQERRDAAWDFIKKTAEWEAVASVPRVTEAAIADWHKRQRQLDGERDMYTGEGRARKQAEVDDGRLHALERVTQHFLDSVASGDKRFARPDAPTYPIRDHDWTRVNVLMHQAKLLPRSELPALLEGLSARASTDDDRARAQLQAILPIVRARLNTEPDAADRPVGEADPLTTAVERGEFELFDEAAYQGQVWREFAERARTQFGRVVQTVSEEGKWLGSSVERTEGVGPGGEVIKNVSTPDLLPVEPDAGA